MNVFFNFLQVEEEEDEEISPDLWQEACWIVIRLGSLMVHSY